METLACVTNNRCTYDCVTNTLTFLGAQEGNNNGSASPTNAEKGEDVQIYVDLSVISPSQSLPNSPMHKGNSRVYLIFVIMLECIILTEFKHFWFILQIIILLKLFL